MTTPSTEPKKGENWRRGYMEGFEAGQKAEREEVRQLKDSLQGLGMSQEAGEILEAFFDSLLINSNE